MKTSLKFTVVVLAIIFLIQISSASELRLLCLDEGDVLKFSRCNPSIQDRTCEASTGCNYCVTEIRNGVYCPSSLNLCNHAELSCSAMQEPISNDNPSDDEEQEETDNDQDNDQETNQDNDQDNEEDNDNDSNSNNQNSNSNSNNNQNSNTPSPSTPKVTYVNSTSKEQASVSFGVGTKIVNTPSKSTNETSSDDSNTNPSSLTGFSSGVSLKQKNIIFFLLGMTIVEIIIILWLLHVQKNKKNKKLESQQVSSNILPSSASAQELIEMTTPQEKKISPKKKASKSKK